MLVSEIYDEVAEAIGSCDSALVFRTITRAVEVLANKGLYDPLVGYLDMSVDGGYYLALPRDVKTPHKININNNPSFARSRLFEFTLNTEGTVEGEEVGWAWSDRGYSPIQDEKKLPGKLAYLCSNPDDEGATLTITGLNSEGRTITETLVAASADQVKSVSGFYSVTRVIREATDGECFLLCVTDTASNPIGQYYGDETEPQYRVIKLSKTGVAIRMKYRRHIFKVESKSDVILLHSPLAVILACRAVRFYLEQDYASAQAAESEAERIINEEQGSRDEGLAMAQEDILTAINANITTVDALIAADVYDTASEIFGPVGREKLFDKMTMAVEILSNKAQWDALLGVVDVWTSNRSDAVNSHGANGSGIFVLPPYIHSVLALNFCGHPQMPKNRWCEFHLNGVGERNRSTYGSWEDLGMTPLVNDIPISLNTRSPAPQKIVAVPDSALDNDSEIRVFGYDTNGRPLLDTAGKPGIVVPCTYGSTAPNNSLPAVAVVWRVTKPHTKGFVQLVGINADTGLQTMLAYYWPQDREPNYRMIRVATARSSRLRVFYRKRAARISSLQDPLHLRSRLAVENMFRALKAMEGGDLQTALGYEAAAVNYLREERVASNPTATASLQFDPGTCPAVTSNVQ